MCRPMGEKAGEAGWEVELSGAARAGSTGFSEKSFHLLAEISACFYGCLQSEKEALSGSAPAAVE
eukprot:365452-Chlamydomonas_euryale.AAC.5